MVIDTDFVGLRVMGRLVGDGVFGPDFVGVGVFSTDFVGLGVAGRLVGAGSIGSGVTGVVKPVGVGVNVRVVGEKVGLCVGPEDGGADVDEVGCTV